MIAKWQKNTIMLALLLAFAFQVLAQTNTSQDVRVQPGDAIVLYIYDSIFVVEKGRFISTYNGKNFVVNGYGEIHLGPLGKLNVTGLTPDQISNMLKEKFKPLAKDPIIIVQPLVRITLRGAFNEPGMYRFSLDMSFWEMIKEVGGLHSLADFEDMYIVRDNKILYKDFEQAFYRAHSLAEMELQSGDEIIVPRVNRLTFNTIMRYVQYGMSAIVFYITILNYRNTR